MLPAQSPANALNVQLCVAWEIGASDTAAPGMGATKTHPGAATFLYSSFSLLTRVATMSWRHREAKKAEAEANLKKSEGYQATKGKKLLKEFGIYLDMYQHPTLTPLI